MNQQETLHLAGSTNAVVTVVVTDHPLYGAGWSVIEVLDTRWGDPEVLPPVFTEAAFRMVHALLEQAHGWSAAQFDPALLVDRIGVDVVGVTLVCPVCHDKLVPRLVRQVVDLIAAILSAQDEPARRRRAIAL